MDENCYTHTISTKVKMAYRKSGKISKTVCSKLFIITILYTQKIVYKIILVVSKMGRHIESIEYFVSIKFTLQKSHIFAFTILTNVITSFSYDILLKSV